MSSGAVRTVEDLVYQLYSLPFPLSPREFLFRRSFHFNAAQKTTTVWYTSAQDDRRPMPDSPLHPLHPRYQGKGGGKGQGGRGGQGGEGKGDYTSARVVRANSPYTQWIFQDLEAYCTERAKLHREGTKQGQGNQGQGNQGRGNQGNVGTLAGPCSEKKDKKEGRSSTLVQIETVVDFGGSLPVWLINQIQRNWPSQTLSAFSREVHRAVQGGVEGGQPLPRLAKW
ncbi:hypothetical protein B484DRAFT_447584, partial [Ochromonadaceae sp. CCMP2298]